VSRGALVAATILMLTACGTTTVDQSIAASADTGITTTLPPIRSDASLVELVADLADSMRHLDEQVIEGDIDEATLARIEAIWVVAAPLARQHSLDMEFGLEQSVDLARTAVERRRPADASKGYKIVTALLATLE
jgi:sigma54-dependent transcription regulator